MLERKETKIYKMLRSLVIFLFAISFMSCEQEPLMEVQSNPDEYKLFSQVYAPTTDTTRYLYMLYNSEDNGVSAEDKLIVAWSNYVVYATSFNMPITGEQFMNYASAYYDGDANTLNSFADAFVISTLQYATNQQRTTYQVDNTWNKFLIPYDINMFIDAGDEVNIIN